MFFKCKTESFELREQNQDQSQHLLQPAATHETFDYVLVANKGFHVSKEDSNKRNGFIKLLREKNFMVNELSHEDQIFYGLRAPDEIFEDYQCLLKISDSCQFCEEGNGKNSHTNRIRIVHSILHNIKLNGENLKNLIKLGEFESMFCLHEEEEQKKLQDKWARWSALFTTQPIFDIKQYFGEKVALYYLWLGWYTALLVPAAALGIVVFLYAVAFFKTSPLIHEVCNSNITMCPRCDKRCSAWQLSDTCTYAKISHLFDNEGTVAFAMFMAIWTTLFLEFWERHRARNVCEWKVYDWCDEEEELIMKIINNPKFEGNKYQHSYWHSTMVFIMITVMLMVIIGIAHAIVVFRVVAAPRMFESDWEFLKENANSVAILLGAVLHYLTIQVMTKVNKWVALKLSEYEKHNLPADREKSFTVMMFTFQFFTLFSSLFYVAFFLGRVNGHPGHYVRIAGYRLEECHPSGCLTDLFIQMAVIMVLKQTLNNIFEYTVPLFKRIFNQRTVKCGQCTKKTFEEHTCDNCQLQDWLKNYNLTKTNSYTLFNEFLEMVIQFSFTTIFVAAFPLAPLLALINNIFEIRLDAIKMVRLEQRLVPIKTNDIGVWTQVLKVVGVLAVIANGLVIGISSDFVPRLVYRYRYGPCASGLTSTHCMQGYIEKSLSTAFMRIDNPDEYVLSAHRNFFNVTPCSYRDYGIMEDNSLTSQFWVVLAIRLVFIILFEHVVVVCKFIAAWFIPSKPIGVKNARQKDKLKRLKDELNLRKDKSTQV